MWPLTCVCVPFAHGFFFEFDVVLEPRDLYHLVCDLSAWEAQSIEWRSPHSQLLQNGGFESRVDGFEKPGVRAIAVGDIDILLRVAAKKCFGKQNATWCTNLLHYLKLAKPSPCIKLNVHKVLIMFILKELALTPEQLLAILALQMSFSMSKEHDTINMFLDVEGSWEYFGKGDGGTLTR